MVQISAKSVSVLSQSRNAGFPSANSVSVLSQSRNAGFPSANAVNVLSQTRNAAIQAAVSHVYPGCTQGNCVVHAKMNLGKKSKLLGESIDEGKLVNKYRFQAPECPSQLCFLCVSRCLLSFLRRSSNPNASSVAKGIEEYYVNEQKCNWYHVSSGMVSANANQFD